MNRALHGRLVEGLYVEAMVMADEARHYLGRDSLGSRPEMSPVERISYSCEALKVTTRLMHIIAWLMAQRGWQRGEISDADVRSPKYRLGEANPTDPAEIAPFPAGARFLMEASGDLYNRVARLEQGMAAELDAADSPARALIGRLESVF